MPDALSIQIADALVTKLNSESWSKSFTAERLYAPLWDLSSLDALAVTVIPRNSERTVAQRGPDDMEVLISVGVQKLLDDAENPKAEADGLMSLCEEFEDFFAVETIDTPYARIFSINREPFLDPQHYRERGSFTSGLSLTYKLEVN